MKKRTVKATTIRLRPTPCDDCGGTAIAIERDDREVEVYEAADSSSAFGYTSIPDENWAQTFPRPRQDTELN